MQKGFLNFFTLSVLLLFAACGGSEGLSGGVDASSFGPAPIISGQVTPLVGLITQNSRRSLFIENAYASCSNVPVEVYTITSDGKKETTPVVSTTLNSSARYFFKKSLVPNVDESNVRYVVEAKGCGAYYATPLLGSSENENIDAKTTFLSFAVNASLENNLKEVTKASLKDLKDGLSGDSLATVFSNANGDTTLQNNLQTVFGADAFNKIKAAEPKIISQNIAGYVNESTTTLYQVNAYQMNPAYDFGYEWHLDGVLQQKGLSNWSYVTDENSQGTKTLLLRVGSDDGSGGVDQSKPFFEKSYQIVVSNTTGPIPVAIALDTADTKSSTNLVNVELNTGVGLANCTSFLTLALTVDDENVPEDADFNITCDTAPTQTISGVDIGSTDGIKFIRLWAKDSSNQISDIPSTISVQLDTVSPTVDLTDPGTILKGGQSVALSFSATDNGTGIASMDLQYAADGVNFATVVNPTPGDLTYSWTVPFDNSSSAKLKLIAVDNVGNSSEVISSAFTVDSSSPLAPSATLTSPQYTTTTAVTFTLANCTDTSDILINNGAQPPAVHTDWQTCSTVADAITYTITAVEESKTLKLWAKDTAGNVSASSTDFSITYDITNPGTPSISLNSSVKTNSTAITMTMANCTDISHVYVGEGSAPLPSDGGWQSCSTGIGATTYTISTTEGARVLKVWAKDFANNMSSGYATINLTYDETLPAVSITDPGSVFRGGESVTINFSTSDVTTSVNSFVLEYASNGSTFSNVATLNVADTSYNWTVPGDDTSVAKLRVISTDEAGNIATATTSVFEIDSTVPSSPSVTLTTGAYTNSTLNTMTMGNCSGTSHVLVNEGAQPIEGDGAWQACTTTANAITYTTDTVQEAKTLKVWAKDLAGNISGNTNLAVTYDTTNPVTSFTDPGTLFRGGEAVTLSFSASDGLSGMDSFILEYAADGTNYTTIQTLANTDTSYGWTVPGDNTTTAKLRVTATDKSGNSNSSVVSTFEIDSTAPGAPSATLTSGAISNSTAVTMTISDCTGISHVQINQGAQPAYNAGTWQVCTTVADAITYTISATETTHSLKVWAKDSADNVGSTSTDIDVLYDVSNPVASLTSFSGGEAYNVNPVNVTWSATDASFGATPITLEYSTNGGTSWSALAGPITNSGSYSWDVTGIEGTQIKVRLTAEDVLGQSTTVTSGSNVILDRTAPAVTMSTPADGSYFQTSITLTGNCEDGIYLYYSGSGILSPFTSASPCSGGSYSQVISFTAGDGAKEITVSQTDISNNTGSVTRTFNRDNVAPGLTRTTGDSPASTQGNSVTWGGACESGLTITVSGDTTDSITCDGTWSWTSPTQAGDGSWSYTLTQTDLAANTTNLPLSWSRDNTPPTFTTNSAGPFTNNLDEITLDGNCEGTNAITATGDITGSFSCSSGSWSWTTPTQSVDTTYNFALTQADAAGNTSVINYVWTRDTSGPGLTVTTGTSLITNTDTVDFSGACETGLDISVTGTVTDTITCPAGTWSWTSPSDTTDGTNTYDFAQTDGSSNTTTVNTTWVRETTAPTISAFTTITGTLNVNTHEIDSNFAEFDISATSDSASVNITHFCINTSTTQPSVDDECWIAVNSPAVSLSPAQTLSLVNYGQLVTWSVGTVDMYSWVKDAAGNISSLTNTGAGTYDTDKLTFSYDPGTPPVVLNIVAANTNTHAYPPTTAEKAISPGGDIYIKWKATDAEGFGATPITLYYTTDDDTFTQIETNLTNGTNGSCTLTGDETGCYKWTGGCPTSDFLRIKVVAEDTSSKQTSATSEPLNVSVLNVIAGNTDTGLDGSAASAMFFSTQMGSHYTDRGLFVVTDDGKVFYRDSQRGLLWVDPATGILKTFIPTTGTSTGDGGSVSVATLTLCEAVALDHQGRLLIWDDVRIRRVDLTNMTIETIIGGGSTSAPSTTVNATDIALVAFDNSWGTLFALPNGNIYFSSNPGSNIYRQYHDANGTVEPIQLLGPEGTGVYGYSATWSTASNRYKRDFAVGYNTSTSAIEYMQVYIGVPVTGNTMQRVSILDHTTGSPYTALDYADQRVYAGYRYDSHVGLDGKTYHLSIAGTTLRRFDHSDPSANQFTTILGNGTGSALPCADGTVATSCSVYINSIFVNKQGKIYFYDHGMIRTINESGNVETIMGQYSSFGDGVNAKSARFGLVYTIDFGNTTVNHNTILVHDAQSREFKEVSIGGTADILTSSSTTYVWSVDHSNGNIYTNYGTMYDYVGATWSQVFGTGADWYHSTTSDGKIGSDVKTTTAYGSPSLAVANGQVLLKQNEWCSGYYCRAHMKLYDIADSYRQSHFAGIIGVTNNAGNSYCEEVTASSCGVPAPYHNREVVAAFYDSVDSKWLFSRTDASYIKERDSSDMIRTYVSLPRIKDGFGYRRNASNQEVFYYCSEGLLYEYNRDTSTETWLDMKVASMSCTGRRFLYHPDNHSVIFVFIQNGLYGVAEYFLPAD